MTSQITWRKIYGGSNYDKLVFLVGKTHLQPQRSLWCSVRWKLTHNLVYILVRAINQP